MGSVISGGSKLDGGEVTGGEVTGGATSKHIPPSYIHYAEKLAFPEEDPATLKTVFENAEQSVAELTVMYELFDTLLKSDPANSKVYEATMALISMENEEIMKIRDQREELIEKFYSFLADGKSVLNSNSDVLHVQRVINPADRKLEIYRIALKADFGNHGVAVMKRGDSYEFFNPWGFDGFDLLLDVYPDAIEELGKKFGIPVAEMTHSIGNYQCDSEECEIITAFRLANSHLDEPTFRGLMLEGIGTTFEPPKNKMDKLLIDGIWRHFVNRILKHKFPLSLKAYPATSLKKGGLVPGAVGAPKQITAHGGELVVPVDTVKAVLRSSAWIDHVKRVQKQHGVSYKAALSLAANIPRGSV